MHSCIVASLRIAEVILTAGEVTLSERSDSTVISYFQARKSTTTAQGKRNLFP
jgi:hypothetical protein